MSSIPAMRAAEKVGAQPNARAARIVILCPASKPPTSVLGIGFGEAQRLGLLEHFGEGPLRAFHFAQDEVAGAVEDAGDEFDLVADDGFAQHLHRRRAAHHRRLEQQRDAAILGEGGELRAVLGDERLVGGDHRLACLKRGFDRGSRRPFGAADQLDEDVDVDAERARGDGIVEPLSAGFPLRCRGAAR